MSASANTMGHDPEYPLKGLRILDLAWVWSAPWATGLLAELGAEVIKVEHPGRLDNSRMSGRVWRDGVVVEGPTMEMAPFFHQINHNKLGITLDLKDPRAIEVLKSLAEKCDVVIENMTAGAIERAGLGWDVRRSSYTPLPSGTSCAPISSVSSLASATPATIDLAQATKILRSRAANCGF